MSDDKQAVESLLTYRRDAVAAILMNLYILAGALRGNQRVPVRFTLHSQLFMHSLGGNRSSMRIYNSET